MMNCGLNLNNLIYKKILISIYIIVNKILNCGVNVDNPIYKKYLYQ